MVKKLKFWGGLFITLISIWLAIQGIDFGVVGAAFGNIQWIWLIIYVIPYTIVMAFKVTRWRLLFYPNKQISNQRLFSSLMISYLWNTILPARLGEVVRGFVVSRSEKIGIVKVFSTILLEKILDIITLVIFLVALLPFLIIADSIKSPVFFLGGGMLLAFLACLLMTARRREAQKFSSFFLKFLPLAWQQKLESFVSDILDTLTILLNLKLSLNIWLQTFLLWGLNTTLFILVGQAIGLNLSWQQGLLVMITTNLGMAVPSSPGYIGTFELVIKITLLPFFPNQESLILTFAILQHLVGLLPAVILGAFYSWREGLTPEIIEENPLQKTLIPAAKE